MSNANEYFSADYSEAKKRFIDSVKAKNGKLTRLDLDAVDLQNQPLEIDIAWFGSQSPRSVILHSSGLHGVEGFSGSAIQLKLLDYMPELPDSVALILVHLLNPYGMAWLRRTNENNVDLNRNYLGKKGAYAGAPSTYAAMNALINPISPPSADFFYTKAIVSILRHGYGSLKQAIAGGQYEYPKGLFYGGNKLQQGLSLYQAWVAENLPAVKNIVALDVHTGLGKKGDDSLFVDSNMGALHASFYAEAQKERICHNYTETVAYQIKGGLVALLLDSLPAANIDFILQEFGSYAPIKVFHALREENRCHFYSNPRELSHPAKQGIKEMFCPHEQQWRSSVLHKGVSLLHSAIKYLNY